MWYWFSFWVSGSVPDADGDKLKGHGIAQKVLPTLTLPAKLETSRYDYNANIGQSQKSAVRHGSQTNYIYQERNWNIVIFPHYIRSYKDVHKKLSLIIWRVRCLYFFNDSIIDNNVNFLMKT